MKLISICVPVLNEEENIINCYNELKNFFEKTNYDYEIIFSDNNSSDKSCEIITQLCNQNYKVKLLKYKKNLGYDMSLLLSHEFASGEAIISIDCDLQDPVYILKDFIKFWENGYDLVYGVRHKRKNDKWYNFMAKIYYRIFNFYLDKKIPNDTGDFKLFDRSILNKSLKQKTNKPYLRKLIYSNSKNSIGIKYEREVRTYGYSKYGFLKAFSYGITMILIHSNFLKSNFFNFIFLINYFFLNYLILASKFLFIFKLSLFLVFNTFNFLSFYVFNNKKYFFNYNVDIYGLIDKKINIK